MSADSPLANVFSDAQKESMFPDSLTRDELLRIEAIKAVGVQYGVTVSPQFSVQTAIEYEHYIRTGEPLERKASE